MIAGQAICMKYAWKAQYELGTLDAKTFKYDR